MRTVKAALLLGLVLAAAGSATASPAIQVVGRSLATIYVDAGRGEGLQVGDRLRVVSGRTTVAEMAVLSVNEHAAACRVLSLTRPIARGDLVVPVASASSRTAKGRTARRPPAATRSKKASTDAGASSKPDALSKGQAVASVPSEVPTRRNGGATSPKELGPSLKSATASGGGGKIAPSASAPAPAPAESPAPPSPSRMAPSSASNAPGAGKSPPPNAAAGPEASPPASDPGPLSDRAFTVKYRSASSAYLDAGRAGGLDVGDRLRVVAGTATIAELEVAYVAELSASCKVLSETRPVQAGDVARLLASAARARKPDDDAEAAASKASTATAPPAKPAAVPETRLARSPSRPSWGRLRGAASFGYLRSWDHTASALDFQQRTARLDLGVDEIAGQPLSFRVRARSRQDVRARTLSARTPQNERADRLYELTLRYEPLGEPVAVELGRIGMYRFVGIGYLDGAIVRLRPRPGLQVGAFGGRRIEIAGASFDGIGRSYGAFVRLVPAGRYVRGGHDVLLAYARDNAEGDVSREYLSLESSFSGGNRWSLFQRAELDLNRGWRQELAGKGYQLSNISLSGNLRLTRSAWAFLSYDGRRNYRYYRNRLVPEEIFDDLLHQGLRAGVNIARPGGFGATAGFGMSLKEADPRHPELNIANAYSFNAGLRQANLFSSGLSAGLNGSGFTNGYADGGLLSVHLGWYVGRGHMVDLSYGYSLYRVIQTAESRNTQWLRVLGRAQLTRWLYVLGDLEYDAGDDLEGPRIFLELGVLF